MKEKDLFQILKESLPHAEIEEREMIIIKVGKEKYLDTLKFLKDLKFDLFIDLFGTHYPATKEIEVIVHLYSTYRIKRIRVKCRVPEDNPVLPSVYNLWKGADWFERETYDMLGVRFEGHPDLKRILTPPGFEDHPLRKDFPFRGKIPRKEKYHPDDKRFIEGEFWF